MEYTLVGYDHGGIVDPPDDRILSLYKIGSQIVAVPKLLQGAELEAALLARLNIDPSVLALKAKWDLIESQASSRPLATMDITQVITWINTNVTNIATAQTAFRELAKEIFIMRAKIDILEEAVKFLFR